MNFKEFAIKAGLLVILKDIWSIDRYCSLRIANKRKLSDQSGRRETEMYRKALGLFNLGRKKFVDKVLYRLP